MINEFAEGRRPKLTLLQACLWGIAATAILLFWVFFIRSGHLEGPVDYESLQGLWVDPYLLGAGVQEVLAPLILLFFLRSTSLFQRAIGGEISSRDHVLLTLMLVGVHLFFMLFQGWITSNLQVQITNGLFVVLVAGLLGGWQSGLATGVVATFTLGLLNYLMWDDGDPYSLNEYLVWYVFQSIEAMAAIWFGFIVGIISDTMPQRLRFNTWAILAIGLACSLIVAVAIFFTLNDSFYYMNPLPSGFVASALGWIAFSVLARSVQNEELRREAETAQLALSEANLNLANTRLALTQAELRALHAQINPHFFFNSLNTIRYFIRTDPDNARNLLTKLSEIFQRSLSAGEYVTLAEEIRHVEAYLSLEKARLEERLQVVWTHLAKGYQGYEIPTLILQPIVENAVIHGISPKPEGGTIHIVINSIGDALLIQVDDDGVGFDMKPNGPGDANRSKAGSTDHTHDDSLRVGSGASIGLTNIHERLRMVYGEGGGLHIESIPGEGTKAVLTIPLRPATG